MPCAPELTVWRRRALALALALAPACAGDSEDTLTEAEDTGEADGQTQPVDDEGPWASLAERPCPEGSEVDGQNFGVGFILTYCSGCHSSGVPADERQMAPAGVDFDNVDDVRAWADRIWARAADQNMTMPPVNSVPDADRIKLGEWLACGAPLDAP